MSVENDFSQVSAESPTASALTLQTRASMPPSSPPASAIQPFRARPVGDVERPAEGLDALGLQRRDRRLDLGRVARADRHVGALVGEGIGDRAADALAAAGDDSLLAFKPEIHTAPDQAAQITPPKSRR